MLWIYLRYKFYKIWTDDEHDYVPGDQWMVFCSLHADEFEIVLCCMYIEWSIREAFVGKDHPGTLVSVFEYFEGFRHPKYDEFLSRQYLIDDGIWVLTICKINYTVVLVSLDIKKVCKEIITHDYYMWWDEHDDKKYSLHMNKQFSSILRRLRGKNLNNENDFKNVLVSLFVSKNRDKRQFFDNLNLKISQCLLKIGGNPARSIQLQTEAIYCITHIFVFYFLKTNLLKFWLSNKLCVSEDNWLNMKYRKNHNQILIVMNMGGAVQVWQMEIIFVWLYACTINLYTYTQKLSRNTQ